MQAAMKWYLTGVLLVAASGPACAYTAYVSNERDNTVSVVDLDQMKTVKTIPVGQRPRGITMTKDGKDILVCASDDDTIQIIDAATLRVVGDLPSGPDPETFALHVSGNPLYVSNEDDNMITVIDVPERKVLAQIPTGVEPEGMAVSPDGQTIVNTSETTNMAHFLDYATRKMVAGVLVDARPRIALFKHDGSEVWVSSELGGTVSVIDPVNHVVTHKISFEVQGLRAEAIQPVGIRFTNDNATAFVALGPANRVAVIDTKTYKVKKLLLVGQRVLADGIHTGPEVPSGHQRTIQRRLGDRRRAARCGEVDPGRSTALGRGRVAEMSADTVTDLAARTTPDDAPAIAALAVRNVSHSYGSRQALQDVSLTVAPSRFTALLGLNGAGKTTLFSLITRLYDTRHGSIDVLGHRVSREPGRALRLLGVVFQARTLDLDISVIDNLLYHAALHGIGRREARKRALAALQEIELADRASEAVRRLSGGQMRRVEIARALLHRPRVLVLDEPTVGLDVASRSAILRHVRSLVSERGVAVLWATHLLDEVAAADAVVVLHRGRVLAAGEVPDVVASAGAADMRSAFIALTGGATEAPE